MAKISVKHNLKISPKIYDSLKEGRQEFIIQFDKHDFKVGDILILQEHTYNTSRRLVPTGETITRTIKLTLRGCKGLQRGYVAIGLEEEECET